MHRKPTPLTPIYKKRTAGRQAGGAGKLPPLVSAQGAIPAQLPEQLLKLMPAVRGQSEEIKRLRGCKPFPRVHVQNSLHLLAAASFSHTQASFPPLPSPRLPKLQSQTTFTQQRNQKQEKGRGGLKWASRNCRASQKPKPTRFGQYCGEGMAVPKNNHHITPHCRVPPRRRCLHIKNSLHHKTQMSRRCAY